MWRATPERRAPASLGLIHHFSVEKRGNKQQKRSPASLHSNRVQKPQEKAFPLSASLFRPRSATGQHEGGVRPSGPFQRAGTPPGPLLPTASPRWEREAAAAPCQGLGRGLRLTQQKGGSSACQEGDKAAPYRKFSFQLPPSECRAGPCQGRACSFHVALCVPSPPTPHPRVIAASACARNCRVNA